MSIHLRKLSSRKLSHRFAGLFLIAGLVSALVAAAIGLSANSKSGSVPQFLTNGIHEIASVTTPSGPAKLVLIPSADGSTCIFASAPDLVPSSSTDPRAVGNAGGSCTVNPTTLTEQPMTVSMGWLNDSSSWALVIHGRVEPTITNVAVVLGDGTTVPASLSQSPADYYVSRITAPGVGQLPGPVEVIGYNAAGEKIASLDLASVLAAATPPGG